MTPIVAPEATRELGRTGPWTTPPATDIQLDDRVCALIADRTLADATGSSVPARTRLTGRSPYERFWLGMLFPEAELAAMLRERSSLAARFTPSAQGFSFRVGHTPATLEVRIAFAVWVALHPTLAEQRDAASQTSTTTDSGDLGDSHADARAPRPGAVDGDLGDGDLGQDAQPDPAVARVVGHQRREPGHPLGASWWKVPVGPVTLRVDLQPGPVPGRPARVRVGGDTLAAAIHEAVDAAVAGVEPHRPRRVRGPRKGTLPRDEDLRDQAAWISYCDDNLVPATEVDPPVWRAAIDLEATTDRDGACEVLLTLVNTSPPKDAQYTDTVNAVAYHPASVDTALYEVMIEATPDVPLRPYDLEQIAGSYRYDRAVAAFGHNAAVDIHSLDDGRTRLRTAHAATAATERIHPRLADLHGRRLDTRFATLQPDPLGALDALVTAAGDWVESRWSDDELDRMQRERGWNPTARAQADADAAAARAEVAWVRAGVDTLRHDPRLLRAFTLMNAAMARVGAAKGYDGWHPFQIAWIAGCLPGMVDPQAHREVCVLWFATGGGKTEAYLGLMLVALFHGRLTGTMAGAQVWARFPLRLLSLQQTERFAEAVLAAEVVRRTEADTRAGEAFGVGYFVGSGNTPNDLKVPHPSDRYYDGPDPRRPDIAERCRVLEHCPVCRLRRVRVEWNDAAQLMEHSCDNPACPLTGPLPVWSVDTNVYRMAPSVLVGTVDKLAQLGQNSAFRVLLGQPARRCPRHGYGADPHWCAIFGCREAPATIPAGFGAIRLEIADELHLLDESLGALDGNYETLFQEISLALGNPPVQIVAATATIEGYQEQCQHLYQREPIRFPTPGPTTRENFWAVTRDGDPLRRYVGIQPRKITMPTAAREVTVTHARLRAEAEPDPRALAAWVGLPEEQADRLATAMRRNYEVMTTYGLRIDDVDTYAKDVAEQPGVVAGEWSIARVTSDAGFQGIKDDLARLLNPELDPEHRITVVAATRAISHGVDVNPLGIMTMMGMPTQAAEFIQASARIGRARPGLVLCLINPTRHRDTSTFRYFAKWATYLDRLVHKVPVNRESLPVLQRVLPGGLMAWLYQVHERPWRDVNSRNDKLRRSSGLVAALTAGAFSELDLIEELQRGFGIDPTSPRFARHREEISRFVDDVALTARVTNDPDRALPDLLDPRPPTSLRDVGSSIRLIAEL